ncbi:MAG: DUF1425 domain-containing protein [Kiritimatiellae bacterium]|nr:DUF1425 domain-containing protein [Kiritimatiellia bacterium]
MKFFVNCVIFCFISLIMGCIAPTTAGISLEKGKIIIESYSFASFVELVEERTTVLDGDFLKTQITIKNKYDKDINFQYQFTWYDKNGMVIKSATQGWKIFNLTGKEETVIQGVCSLPDAKEFKLTIRPL